MLIARISQYSGEFRELDLDITQEQIDKYNEGELLQNAFPNLSKADREYLKSGITDEEWKEMVGGFSDVEDEEEDDNE